MEESLFPTSLIPIQTSHHYFLKCLKGKWLCFSISPLLKTLIEISDCHRHESLPEEGLPTSLSLMTIRRCLLLQANCQSNGVKEWSKVAHIPYIITDNKLII
ncbi:hypothetical protein TSUD_118610 [Trifolium subterraneum]|uniref:Uncharacterized protein n=1 Tax=Trifolium subterraneum TaxID=3900 RepID=A0A2Z6M760_TRISU|nr:hypothetical protein TSUD_118610 [Trifolium subterraneum]